MHQHLCGVRGDQEGDHAGEARRAVVVARQADGDAGGEQEAEVGEDGVGLSMGERQRLQIARMLVDKPRLLVLDEATANLDYATELDVRAALEEISPKPTMLVIAHRYTMMKNADYVYVLKEGQLAEHGKPAEQGASGE